MQVLRWGRTEVETDEALALERAGVEACGSTWTFDPAATGQDLPRADVLVVPSRSRVTAAVLERVGPRLVLTTTSGHDHVDLAACAARGVEVARSPLARRDAVVEHTLAGLITMLRAVPQQVGAARHGRWSRGALPGLAPRGLAGARVMVVGLGVIGSRLSGLLGDLGAHVVGVDPAVPGATPPDALDALLPEVDAVTLHCSLTPSSRGLLSARRLGLLAPDAVVVNTARGPCLDADVAVRAVWAGRLGGLVCDVFPDEPYPHLARGDHPRIWLTPHAAGYTRDLGERVAREVVQSVRAWGAGEGVPHPVRADP